MQAEPPTPAAAATPQPLAGPHATAFDRTPAAPYSHGQSSAAAHAAHVAQQHAAPRTAFVTGAYQPSGDVFIDRMLQLEAALKRNGAVI